MPFQDFSFTTMKCRRVFTTTRNAQSFLVTWSSSMRYFSTSTASFIFCPAVFYATFQPLTTSVTTNWGTVWINVKPLITSFDLFKKKLKPGFYFCCWWVVVLRFRLNFITLPLRLWCPKVSPYKRDIKTTACSVSKHLVIQAPSTREGKFL